MAEDGKKPGDSGFKAPAPSGSISKGVEKKGAVKEKGVGSLDPKKPAAEGKKEEGPKKEEGAKKELKFGPAYKSKKLEGEVWSSKTPGGDDKAFVSVLEGKASFEALSGSVDLEKKAGKLTLIEGKAEVTGVHGEVDLIDKIKHLLFGDPPKPPTPPTTPMAARVGDLTMHVAPLMPGPGSTNVFIGGMPAWRVGLDQHLCPAPGAGPHGGGPAMPGTTTVLINGAPAARATDFIVEPAGGPDVIAIGCPTVFIGIVTPPPPPPKEAAKESDPWVIFESVASGDVVKVEGSVVAVAEGSLADRKGKVEGKAELMGAVLKGELPLKVRVRIPFTSYYVGLGLKVEGTLLSAGAAVEGGVKINDGKTFFEATGGAKAGVGVGGLGAKVSLDVSKK